MILSSFSCVCKICIKADLIDSVIFFFFQILEILLSDKDVDINAVNRSCCTALHIAAHKCLPHCVWVLLQHKPNVNLQVFIYS